jgi:hypothetical protein
MSTQASTVSFIFFALFMERNGYDQKKIGCEPELYFKKW